ncbi:hypothetical protein GSH08_04085 [Burkholderia pseudomallei]|nr:hypothetical protein [Burkholderia pseudomallei]MBM5582844.1 hypothetical protein [Burkholderia pseudomallei]RPA06625.1 hypothetical protein EGT86_02075 [Burkholderia pseudomallei]
MDYLDSSDLGMCVALCDALPRGNGRHAQCLRGDSMCKSFASGFTGRTNRFGRRNVG